jgi:hypothetical protein
MPSRHQGILAPSFPCAGCGLYLKPAMKDVLSESWRVSSCTRSASTALGPLLDTSPYPLAKPFSFSPRGLSDRLGFPDEILQSSHHNPKTGLLWLVSRMVRCRRQIPGRSTSHESDRSNLGARDLVERFIELFHRPENLSQNTGVRDCLRPS